jgi:hypothetical protein
VIEANLEDFGGGRVAGNMPTEFSVGTIRAHHHTERVPTHECGQTLFKGKVSGMPGLRVQWNGISIASRTAHFRGEAEREGMCLKFVQKVRPSLGSRRLDDSRWRISPLLSFERVSVWSGG